MKRQRALLWHILGLNICSEYYVAFLNFKCLKSLQDLNQTFHSLTCLNELLCKQLLYVTVIIQQISQSKYHKPEFYPSPVKGITWIILLACLGKSMVICNVACLEDKKWIIFLQDWAEQKSSQLQSSTYH